jgi:putative transposase
VKLRWRSSCGSRHSLDWISFEGDAIGYRNGQLFIGKMVVSLGDSNGLASYEFGVGNMQRGLASAGGISTSV